MYLHVKILFTDVHFAMCYYYFDCRYIFWSTCKTNGFSTCIFNYLLLFWHAVECSLKVLASALVTKLLPNFIVIDRVMPVITIKPECIQPLGRMIKRQVALSRCVK